MISVSVETDIDEAIRQLNLLPKEAERAAYRAINKVADEIKKDSAQRISDITGIPKAKVFERMYVKGASAGRLIAKVAALPSAKNVGYYTGAYPVPGKAGVSLTAWRQRTVYDRTFVMGTKKALGSLRRKVWKRYGRGPDQISDSVWGPSIRKTFERPSIYYRNLETIQRRWPFWFERYLRAEIVRLQGADALTGVKSVLPSMTGPTFSDE